MGRKKQNSRKAKKIFGELIILILFICIGEICYSSNIIDLNSVFSSSNAIDEEANSTKPNFVVQGEQNLKIYYFDVGQADCELLICDDQTMLIDGGNNGDGPLLVDYIKNLGITKLDYVIGTHPHEDHIGGLDDLIENFEVGQVYLPAVVSTTKTFEDVISAIEKKNLQITVPEVGDNFNVGKSNCKVLMIDSEDKNANNNSIIIRTDFYNNSFLFMGDLESDHEKNIKWDEATVLKVGHHGSDTSSSSYFLNSVLPKYSIISVGEGNSYNHPSSSIIQRLQSMNSTIYRTDEKGTILLNSDGNDISFEFIETNTNSK